MSLSNKMILITGGTGSFGQKLTEVLLTKHNPKSVCIYDNRELVSVEMARKFSGEKLRFIFGDVRDEERLRTAMEGVDIVVHTAAIKHVTVCEYNPVEAVKTNIGGAINVIKAALNAGVDKVIAISTDKAAYPVNLYGATKMVAEKIFVQANFHRGAKNTKFSCIRYGNALASSGSVVPLFLEQKKKGEITLTDERMTRFWITLDQAINFIINCIEVMNGGEIFVPKISSTKITNLAEVIAPGVKRKIVGIRPGERIDEILLTEEEARHAKEFKDYFIIFPELPFWDKKNHKDGKSLPEGFEYCSSVSKEWLTKEQIKKILKNHKIF
jgi:UDP-N-acetylglucosamine 4,6-dehydratase (inverting)